MLKNSNILNSNKFIIKQKIWGEYWDAWWITRYTSMANAQPKLNDSINSAVDEKN